MLFVRIFVHPMLGKILSTRWSAKPRRLSVQTAQPSIVSASHNIPMHELLVFSKTEWSSANFCSLFQPPADLGATIRLVFPDASLDGHVVFNGDLFMSRLKTQSLGHLLLAAEQLTSTQEVARQCSQYLPEGTVVVANKQSSGKGLGEVAHSILKDRPLGIKVKWPNDIYCGSQKIGGTLIHSTWQGNGFRVIVGVGLNLSNSQPTTCLHDIVRGALTEGGDEAAVEQLLCKEAVLAAIINRLESTFLELEAHGWAPLAPRYLAAWMHSDQRLVAQDGAELGGGAAVPAAVGGLSLTVMGISPAGFLLAQDDAGHNYELTPDGNSLDMMQGLIRRKLPATQ